MKPAVALGLADGHPLYAVARARARQRGLGVVRWHTVRGSASSGVVWNSARDLRCKGAATCAQHPGQSAAGPLALHRARGCKRGDAERVLIELWDPCKLGQDTMVTMFELPVASAAAGGMRELQQTVKGRQVTLRCALLPPPPPVKTVFFIRHGESAWNSAKADMNVSKMLGDKRNFGGKDSTGSHAGPDFKLRIREAMQTLLPRQGELTRYVDAVEFDAAEVQCEWWNTSKESAADLEARAEEFLTQLRYCPESRIIVVGHSHFTRYILSNHMAEGATIHPSVGATAEGLRSRVLCNCGVAGVRMDFRRSPHSIITEVGFLFGTRLKGEKGAKGETSFYSPPDSPYDSPRCGDSLSPPHSPRTPLSVSASPKSEQPLGNGADK
eukprot:gene25457-26188_t